MRVLVASRNTKKLRELERVLDARRVAGIELVSLRDVMDFPEAPETGRTFGDNALLKARDAARHTGLVSVADDSGLSVDELNGMPGVLSARWSGSHAADDVNMNLVLGQMADVPDERRGAAFVSVCAVVVPEVLMHRAEAVGLLAPTVQERGGGIPLSAPITPGEFVARGEWRGRIIREPRGDNGFGYDPIFIPEEEDARAISGGEARTSAELSAEEKDAQSHRGRALAQLVPLLRSVGTM
ncbi:non-canonical purine NTP pyrophosphatase [Corynebacterium kroppenstedtii]|uniref:non-canonical purine NTP pyrophosphatase n=1 Tax=Corynebacterium sp. PCR 32 TaxID=3351342 RepID=UPI0030A3D5CD